MKRFAYIFALILLVVSGTLARELPDGMLPVNVVGVQNHPESQTPIVLLVEPESRGVVPIFIGASEAQAIRLAMESISTPRPMTHDTAVAIMRSLDGELERLIIDQLTQNTYLALLEIQRGEDKLVYVDVRPSDGLALAVRTGAAVWVARDLLLFPDATGRWQPRTGPSL